MLYMLARANGARGMLSLIASRLRTGAYLVVETPTAARQGALSNEWTRAAMTKLTYTYVVGCIGCRCEKPMRTH